MFRLIFAAGTVTSAVLLAACAHSPPPSSVNNALNAGDIETATRLAARFDSLRTAARIPGLAVVILRDTTVILARGFGYADVERGVTVTPETPFNIASVTKPIAAVVALRLVEKGVLYLDRSMRSYKGFTEFCSDVRKAGGIFFGDYACEDSGLTLRHVLSMRANGPPGTRFFYNPPSYSWASRPMAEVSGRAFSDLVDSLVFRPAGMTRSARIHRRLPLRPQLADALAKPYHVDSAGHLVPSDPPGPQGDGAAGGVISTVADLARFDIALTQGRLLTSASMRTMWTAGRSPSGGVLPYGIGWFIGAVAGEPVYWHTGLWEGAYSALYVKVHDRHLTLIMLANSDGLSWPTRLDEAAIERSSFVMALLSAFPN